MPAPISTDLRKRVVEVFENEGLTREQTAERFGVGPASVYRWVRLHRESGSVEPAQANGGPKPKVSERDVKLLLDRLEERPDLTLRELGDALADAGGARLSKATIGRMLKKAGWTLKKSVSGPAKWTRNVSSSSGTHT